VKPALLSPEVLCRLVGEYLGTATARGNRVWRYFTCTFARCSHSFIDANTCSSAVGRCDECSAHLPYSSTTAMHGWVMSRHIPRGVLMRARFRVRPDNTIESEHGLAEGVFGTYLHLSSILTGAVGQSLYVNRRHEAKRAPSTNSSTGHGCNTPSHTPTKLPHLIGAIARSKKSPSNLNRTRASPPP
jgi:hypothetical protein